MTTLKKSVALAGLALVAALVFPNSKLDTPDRRNVAPVARQAAKVSSEPGFVPVDAHAESPAVAETKLASGGWHQFYREAQQVTVTPYADMPVAFTLVGVREDGRYMTWCGTNPQFPKSFLVAEALPDGGTHSVMVLSGSSQFEFHTFPNGVTTVTEMHPGEEGCFTGGVLIPNRPGSTLAASTSFKSADMSNPVGPSTPAPTAFVANAATTVTVMALYTQDTLTNVAFQNDNIITTNGDGTYTTKPSGNPVIADVPAYIDARTKAYVDSANMVLANSGVTNFLFSYVGSSQIAAYTRTDTSNIDVDLAAISGTGVDSAAVTTASAAKGADLSVLWISNLYKGVTAAGMANTTPGKVQSASLARAVATWGTSYKVMLHEVGHLMGLEHDRANAGTVGNVEPGGASVPDSNGLYCYGTMWTIKPGAVALTAGTIMSYGSYITPEFSTPKTQLDITSTLADSQSNPVIDWGTQVLGFDVSDPKAAYNAKVISDNAATAAALQTPITVPTITSQPTGTTVTAGNSFSLSVTATGGGLSYQWFLGTVSISGATSATFSKSSASTSDSGNYTVTITNSAGSVTSNAVAVTVNAAAVTPPPSGGGGGAPSPLFLLALAGLGARRILRARQVAS